MIKRILHWIEEKYVTGKTVHDFGVLYKPPQGTLAPTLSLLLCRKGGVDQIVIRHAQSSFFASSLSHTVLPTSSADTLAEKFDVLANHLKSK